MNENPDKDPDELELRTMRHDDAHLVVVEPQDPYLATALCDSCEWATVASDISRAKDLAWRHVRDAGGQGVLTTSRAGLGIYRPQLHDRLAKLEKLRGVFFDTHSDASITISRDA